MRCTACIPAHVYRFVWDQAWAELSYQLGKAYYPKLQVGP